MPTLPLGLRVNPPFTNVTICIPDALITSSLARFSNSSFPNSKPPLSLPLTSDEMWTLAEQEPDLFGEPDLFLEGPTARSTTPPPVRRPSPGLTWKT